MISTSILSSNKSIIIIYRNSTNNGNSDRDSGSDNDGVNEDNNAKIIWIQDKPSMLVNYEIIM